MKSFEGFRSENEIEPLKLTQEKKEAEGASFVEIENQQLERENLSLRQQINEIKRRLAESTITKKVLDVLYLINTRPEILIKSLEERLSSEKSLNDIIADIERQQIEKDFAISIVEPGEIARDVTTQIRWSLDMTAETNEIIGEAISEIQRLSEFSEMDIRKLADLLKIIPSEHLSQAIKTVEKTPIKDVLKLLGEFAEKLSFVADREAIDQVKKIQSRLFKDKGSVGAYIRTDTKQVVFGMEFSSLFGWGLIHETGHGVYDNFLSDQQRKKWSSVCRKSVTTYGRHVAENHQANENFSEMYTLYLLNRPLYQVLALTDTEFAEQYRFFQQLMPDVKSGLPRVAGILFPLQDWSAEKVGEILEKITKTPVATGAKDHLKYTYDHSKRDELEKKHREKASKKAAETVTSNPYGREFLENRSKSYENNREFDLRENHLVHRQRKIFRLIKEAGLFDKFLNEAQGTFIGGRSLRSITNDSMYLMRACVMADIDQELLNKIHGEAAVFFLEDRLMLVGSEGVNYFFYRENIQEQIDQALSSQNLEDVIPLSREVQLDALRAHAQPTAEDRKAREDFRKKYGLQLEGTKKRNFSEHLVGVLEEALSGLPINELRKIKGFCLVPSEQVEKSDNKKDVVTLTERDLTHGGIDLKNLICHIMAEMVAGEDKKIFDSFLKVGGWKDVTLTEPKAVLKRLAIHAVSKFRGGGNADIREYLNENDKESSFLIWRCRAHPRLDFVICYKWFLLNNNEFKNLAEKDNVLKRKYDFFVQYFKH